MQILAFFLASSALATPSEIIDTQSIPLINHGYFFGIDVEVGTPAQSIQLLLDTGSDQVWLPSLSNRHCIADLQNADLVKCGGTYGYYNESTSSTKNITGEKFSVGYLDGMKVDGVLMNDNFKIGKSVDGSINGLVIPNAQFGVGKNKNTDSTMGVFGLSLSSFKKVEGYAVFDRQNIVHQMNRQGLLEGRNVFSIWLNKPQTDAGSILFGAVDRAKFSPPLKALKMVNNNDRYGKRLPVKDFEVIVTDIFLRTPDNYYDTTSDDTQGYSLFGRIDEYSTHYISGIFDTGSYSTYVPNKVYKVLLEYLKGYIVEKDDDDGGEDDVFIECLESTRVSDLFELSIKFGTTVMAIPFDFLVDHINDTGTAKIKQNGINYCKLNVKPLVEVSKSEYEDKIIFGQGILRSLYTVYDLDKFEISIAPARYTNESDIVNVTLQNDIDNEPDGSIDQRLLPDVYDQRVDFIANTREYGFLKPLGSTAAIPQPNKGVLCFLVALFVGFALVL